MSEARPPESRNQQQDFLDRIGAKETRKLRAREERYRSLWFGLGMFGIVGWSVAVPTVLGVAAGLWIDRHWPSRYSWTLMLLFIGVVLGCLNAWYWLQEESRQDRSNNPPGRRRTYRGQ
jgi:ATP synthase protein I